MRSGTRLFAALCLIAACAPVAIAWTRGGPVSAPVHDDASLVEAARIAANSDPRKAIMLTDRILAHVADGHDPDMQLAASAVKILALVRLGEVDAIDALSDEARRLAGRFRPSARTRAELHGAYGMVHEVRGDLAAAFVEYQQAYEYWQQAQEPARVTDMLVSMAGLYLESGEVESAIRYYRDALEASKDDPSTPSLVRILNNLGYAYTLSGAPETALEYLTKAREQAITEGSRMKIAYATENIGEAYLLADRLDEAEGYLLTGLAEAESMGLSTLASSAQFHLGRLELARGNDALALTYATRAETIATQSNDIPRRRDNNLLLSQIYRRRGDADNALKHLDLHLEFKERVNSLNTKRKLSLLEAQFSLSQKEKEIELLRRNDEINLLRLNRAQTFKNGAIAGGVILTLVVLVLIFTLRQMAAANRRSEERAQELLETKRNLEKANSIKSDILAMTSHEVRTPLNGIMGMAQILLRSDLDPDQKLYAETIYSSGANLVAILNDILDLSKIEAGRLEIRKEAFPVAALSEALTRLWQGRAQDKGLDFSIEVDPALPPCLMGDPQRLQQVLSNLVSNAIKFTKAGSIVIRLREETRTAERLQLSCEVEDSGIGIAANLHERIFEPFLQVDAGASRSYDGTGLGLAICRQLCQLMGGTIGVRSTPGKGSTFWFAVPCDIHCEEMQPEAADDSAAPPALLAMPQARILVAEDNPLNQMVIKQLLAFPNLDVSFVADGRQAVEQAREGTFDLILMDIRMPVMDGKAATQAIRRLPGKAARVPIIALTADAMEDDRRKALGAGFDDYVTKPIDEDILIAVIAKHLSVAAPDGSGQASPYLSARA
ncbi:MAG: ATP-binding protein [Pseudomonadota bacterium]